MDYAALGYRDCSSKLWAIQKKEVNNAVIISRGRMQRIYLNGAIKNDGIAAFLIIGNTG